MRGPEGVSDHMAGWLTDRIPARLRVLEARLDLPANSLADPAKVRAHEDGPLGLEDWPAVYVLPQGLRAMDLVEVRSDASEVYRSTYGVRVLAWVRADGYAATDQLRKRYVLAIREALLERKALTPQPTYGSGDYTDGEPEVAVQPASIREDYSDVFTDDAARTIAGAWLDVDVTLVEVLDGPTALGVAELVDVTLAADTAGVPPHPAL